MKDIGVICILCTQTCITTWLYVYRYVLYFFFFQAEDGIRDIGVTGVQTCALPISDHQRRRADDDPAGQLRPVRPLPGRDGRQRQRRAPGDLAVQAEPERRGAVEPDRKSVV